MVHKIKIKFYDDYYYGIPKSTLFGAVSLPLLIFGCFAQAKGVDYSVKEAGTITLCLGLLLLNICIFAFIIFYRKRKNLTDRVKSLLEKHALFLSDFYVDAQEDDVFLCSTPDWVYFVINDEAYFEVSSDEHDNVYRNKSGLVKLWKQKYIESHNNTNMFKDLQTCVVVSVDTFAEYKKIIQKFSDVFAINFNYTELGASQMTLLIPYFSYLYNSPEDLMKKVREVLDGTEHSIRYARIQTKYNIKSDNINEFDYVDENDASNLIFTVLNKEEAHQMYSDICTSGSEESNLFLLEKEMFLNFKDSSDEQKLNPVTLKKETICVSYCPTKEV